MEKEFKYREKSYREIGRSGEFIAAECIEEDSPAKGIVTFIEVREENGELHGNCSISYCVTRERFCQVMSEAKTQDKDGLIKALRSVFYKIPRLLCEILADAYLEEKKGGNS